MFVSGGRRVIFLSLIAIFCNVHKILVDFGPNVRNLHIVHGKCA